MDYIDFKRGLTDELFWFRAKRELLDMMLGQAAPSPSRQKVLSVGCGVGYDLDVMARMGEVYVMDTEAKALQCIPDASVVQKKLGDICSGGFDDGFFDTIVAMDVLEHIEDDACAIAQIARMLRPGGSLVLTVPAFQFLYSAHDSSLGHKRRYSKPTLLKLLDSRFKVQKIGYWTGMLFVPLAIQRLIERGQSKPTLTTPPRLVNSALYGIMRLENSLIRHGIPMPFGTSIYAICTRKS